MIASRVAYVILMLPSEIRSENCINIVADDCEDEMFNYNRNESIKLLQRSIDANPDGSRHPIKRVSFD